MAFRASSPVDFGRGRPTYDAHPRYPRSASTSRVPFTSHTENYIYTGTGAAVQIPQRPLQRRPSFHAPSDAFHARREAYQQARAAFIASERQYQASLMAFRATGARINSRPHAMLLQAHAQVANARVRKEQAGQMFAASGGSERELLRVSLCARTYLNRRTGPPDLPSPLNLAVPDFARAVPGGVIVTGLRTVPGYTVIPLKRVGETAGNHDGIFGSPAQKATLKQRLITAARRVGADAVIELKITEYDVRTRVPTLIGQGIAVRLVPCRAAVQSYRDIY